MSDQTPQFFETAETMRAWLHKNHATASELLVGYFKTHTFAGGKASITWPQSVAEALCFGWIDGIRKSLDKDRYTTRFTPRRPESKWSAVNVRLMAQLESSGRMTEEGRIVFQARKNPDSKGYKAQKKIGAFDGIRVEQFQRNKAAWAFFRAQPPGYQKQAAWWVMQAKQEATRTRRLDRLIQCSTERRRLA